MANELYHHGIIGQRWGVRRYQNEDGTYTEAGNQRRKPSKVNNVLATGLFMMSNRFAARGMSEIMNLLNESGRISLNTYFKSQDLILTGKAIVDGLLLGHAYKENRQ